MEAKVFTLTLRNRNGVANTSYLPPPCECRNRGLLRMRNRWMTAAMWFLSFPSVDALWSSLSDEADGAAVVVVGQSCCGA
ncbi:hypothetical protein WN943_023752 [Citrus x changshan-huyou]